MAVKSLLNPGSIVSERSIEPAKLQNFITGGAPLGESVVSSAANKIVGFQRGAAGVAARPPDLGSIIDTLSSNILNNVENRVQSINQNITQVVSDRLNLYDKELKGRLDKTESAKPNGILSNFLKLYQQAIEYIQFLGNRKNVKTLGDNIKELQKVFTETFEVAKIIRQTIVKIVKQLSNLPTASGAGGGLNLDIDIPGGPLRRTLPRGVANIGKMALAGGAIAGAGMLGGKVISGMMDAGGEVQATPTVSSEGISGPLLNRFSEILDRFDRAISSLSRTSKSTQTSSQGKGSTGTSPTEKTPGSPGSSPGGGNIQTTGTGTPEQQALLSSISFAEGTTKSYGVISGGDVNKDLEAGKLTVKEVIDLGNTFGRPGSKHKWSGATGKYQFMPNTLQMLIAKGVLKPNEKFTPQKQDEAALALASMRGVTADVLKKEGLSANVANKLSPEWASFPTLSGRSYYGQSVKKLGDIQKTYSQNLSSQPSPTATTKPTQQTTPSVSAAPTQASTTQQISQTVAQQPGANQPSKPLMVPLNLTGSQQQQPTPPSPPPPPPILNPTGTKIRNVSSTNFDNFYTVHSRLTFNIVE